MPMKHWSVCRSLAQLIFRRVSLRKLRIMCKLLDWACHDSLFSNSSAELATFSKQRSNFSCSHPPALQRCLSRMLVRTSVLCCLKVQTNLTVPLTGPYAPPTSTCAKGVQKRIQQDLDPDQDAVRSPISFLRVCTQA
ncbi:hypothetical protein O6H91_10G060800 [Diphasiastrum complanatum]|uniref:Uncharacterized protein n=1 Tax=Diphasiastrum complanatum TaxID=34168 RepID=A0ACC2CHM6_DIPCM|nr:hypothetical protein O6H91_10G060800 [Diphasiastrum complanatum]